MKTPSEIEKDLADARQRVVELEAALKEVKQIKVGDYVVGRTTGRVGVVTETTVEDIIRLKLSDGETTAGNAFSVRFATRNEITKYLLDEAERAGFKEGVFVSHLRSSGRIDKLEVFWPNEHIGDAGSVAVADKGNAASQPFVVARYGGGFYVAPISDLSLSSHICVTVESGTYNALFHPGYVEFGCAKIANGQIRAAYELTTPKREIGSNREIEAVQIGKGLFTRGLLSKMLPLLKEPEDDGYDYYTFTRDLGWADYTRYVRVQRGGDVYQCVRFNGDIIGPFSLCDGLLSGWYKQPNLAAAEAVRKP